MIKNWYVKHKDTGKWHKVLDVKDNGIPADKPGGGNMVSVEGINDPVHASKFSDMKPPSDIKKDDCVVIVKPDCEQQSEDSRIPKSAEKLKKRWQELKKAIAKQDSLDNEKAFMSFTEDPEDDNEQAPEMENADPESTGEIPEAEAGGEQPEGETPEEDGDPQGVDAGELHEAATQDPTEDDSEDLEQPDVSEMSEEEKEQELYSLLQDEGYSDVEIAHIIHGHTVPEATVDDHKMQNEALGGKQKRSNEQRSADADHEHDQKMKELERREKESQMLDPEREGAHRQRMLDTEYQAAVKDNEANALDIEHKKRVLDLEYKQLQEEKELEVDYKKEELQIKLQQLRNKATAKSSAPKPKSNSKDVNDTNVSVNKNARSDAKQISKKEKAGKI